MGRHSIPKSSACLDKCAARLGGEGAGSLPRARTQRPRVSARTATARWAYGLGGGRQALYVHCLVSSADRRVSSTLERTRGRSRALSTGPPVSRGMSEHAAYADDSHSTMSSLCGKQSVERGLCARTTTALQATFGTQRRVPEGGQLYREQAATCAEYT